jgi:hypothetical protein
MPNTIFSGSQVDIKGLDQNHFSSDGLQVLLIEDVIKKTGFSDVLDEIKAKSIKIEPNSVQSASTGIIQDPAGSAVGQAKPSGGGASGGIYKAFPDLDGIPKIGHGASVFNTSSGPGKRVLHTYSPEFSMENLKPSITADCNRALTLLTNAYINAYLASADASADPTGNMHGTVLINLVPLSGKIFAGNFADKSLAKEIFEVGHLHPSYTIASILLAQGYLFQNKDNVLDAALHYWTGDTPKPYNAAVKVMTDLNW